MGNSYALLLIILPMLSISSPSLAQEIPLDSVANRDFPIGTLEGKYNDIGRSVQQTTDGGYIIAGYTCASDISDYDISLIKTDANGNKSWDKRLGGPDDDRGESVHQTSNGVYIITGYTKSYGSGAEDVWLIKTDYMGNELWNKTFGGLNDDRGREVQQTADGGYIIVGSTASFGDGNYDVWLIKTNSNGDEIWSRTYGGGGLDEGSSVKQTSDGGYVLTGWTGHSGSSDRNVLVIKTDSNGNEIWEKNFGDLGIDEGNFIIQAQDGGYLLVGGRESYDGENRDLLVIKTDLSGGLSWSKTFDKGSWDEGNSVWQAEDGGYIIAGDTSNRGGYADIWLIKTGVKGNKVWDKTIGGKGINMCFSVQQAKDRGYILLGTKGCLSNNRDVWLIKTNSEGNTIWSKTFGRPGEEVGKPRDFSSEC